MPSSPWSEWVKIGIPALVGGVALVGAAAIGAFASPPLRPFINVAGWALIVFAVVCFVLAALQVRHLSILAARRERRELSADAANLGFEEVENAPFLADERLLGWRVRLRPKGYIFEALLRFEYDAALVSYRWRVEGRPGGRYPHLRMPLEEMEIAERSARTIEIGFTGPPTLTPDTDLVFEFIGADPICVTRVARLR